MTRALRPRLSKSPKVNGHLYHRRAHCTLCSCSLFTALSSTNIVQYRERYHKRRRQSYTLAFLLSEPTAPEASLTLTRPSFISEARTLCQVPNYRAEQRTSQFAPSFIPFFRTLTSYSVLCKPSTSFSPSSSYRTHRRMYGRLAKRRTPSDADPLDANNVLLRHFSKVYVVNDEKGSQLFDWLTHYCTSRSVQSRERGGLLSHPQYLDLLRHGQLPRLLFSARLHHLTLI